VVRGSPLVIHELNQAPPDRIGGKAAGLARLVELGLPVPPTLVLPFGEELDDPEAIIRRLGEPLAVRSSAAAEDARNRSAAGQYATELGVSGDRLLSAVERVRADTARANSYGITGPVAVVIQPEIPATRAGVAFSRDPVTGDDIIFVECARGRGDAVVSGTITPDRYWIGDSVRARAAAKLRTLRDDEAREVAALVRKAERGFGFPVDVEFCFEGRTIWLVQCRPITTL
jgi:phosphoenolpyruvate synthase/pyruvate phosphate dikinase